LDDLDVFTARELRQRSGELLRDAEQGRIALITKHGRPALLALPFDDRLLRCGVARALALHLFEARYVTLARGAKLADMSVEEFIELLGESGIDAVDYSPDELEAEVETAG
jgi:prevent-host-death family protein